MDDFRVFARAVHARLVQMNEHELYSVGPDNRAFEAVYLSAWPEGTNNIFRTRPEYDCSCCKQFIRNFGRVVTIRDGRVQTVWSDLDLPYPFDVVAQRMDGFVKDRPIEGLFRTRETRFGQETTVERLENGGHIDWNHFHGHVASRHRTEQADKMRGDYASRVAVFRRGLETISSAALADILGLIDDRALYRGDEHRPSIERFASLQRRYSGLHLSRDRELFVWEHAADHVSIFRNTVIGTLAVDISEGMDIDAAVRAFETKVAPTNYKRPTAVVTQKMIDGALATIKELGLESALQRRHARMSDITVNNVLWVASQDRNQMKSAVEAALSGAAATPPVKRPVAVNATIEQFMSQVAPGAKSIELLVKSEHAANFVSLTAPVHAGEPKLFKWPNDFAWSYDGNITDSIKEKVKRAGGNVTNAQMRFSLAWSNLDDLDIRVTEPDRNEICYYNKCDKLDVDMNAGWGRTREPVENISWRTVQDGVYLIEVDQFQRRETADPGFTIEIESGGILHHLSYKRGVMGRVLAAKVTVANGLVIDIHPGPDMAFGGMQIEKWGITTEKFSRVRTVLLSPNHWDNLAIGNKHWIFVLDGCRNPDEPRGIYNEFLRSELAEHRKVFEVLGNRLKCPVADEQLSGIGFSSTGGGLVVARVESGSTIRTYNVTI